MQNQLPIPHSLADWFWFILASFFTIGGSAGFWAWLQNRKKIKAEAREHEARSRNLDVQSTVSAGDVVLRYIDRLSNSEATIIVLKQELADWKDKAEDREAIAAERDLLQHQLTSAKIEARYWELECRKLR